MLIVARLMIAAASEREGVARRPLPLRLPRRRPRRDAPHRHPVPADPPLGGNPAACERRGSVGFLKKGKMLSRGSREWRTIRIEGDRPRASGSNGGQGRDPSRIRGGIHGTSGTRPGDRRSIDSLFRGRLGTAPGPAPWGRPECPRLGRRDALPGPKPSRHRAGPAGFRRRRPDAGRLLARRGRSVPGRAPMR